MLSDIAQYLKKKKEEAQAAVDKVLGVTSQFTGISPDTQKTLLKGTLTPQGFLSSPLVSAKERTTATKELAKTSGKIAKEVAQSTARSVPIAAGAIPGVMQSDTVRPSQSKLASAVFGPEDFKVGVPGATQVGESVGLNGKAATFVGSVLVGADIVDPSPIPWSGSASKVARKLAKTQDAAKIVETASRELKTLPEASRLRIIELAQKSENRFEIEQAIKDEIRGGVTATQDALKSVGDTKNVDEIIARRTKATEDAIAAANGKGKTLSQLATDNYIKARTALQDKYFPILGKLKGVPRDEIDNMLNLAQKADQQVEPFLESSGFSSAMKSVGLEDYDAFNQYLISRHNMYLDAAGIDKGLDAAEDMAIVAKYKDKFEPIAEQVTRVTEKLMDLMVEAGTISTEMADYLKKIYPKYVPLNVVLEEAKSPFQTTKAIASLSKQNTIQKIVGSKRAIYPPTESIILKAHQAFNEIMKNKAARAVADTSRLPDNPLGVTKIDDFDDITNRKEAIKGMSEAKSVRESAKKIIQKGSKQVKALQESMRAFLRDGDIKYTKKKKKGERAIAEYSKNLASRAKRNVPKTWDEMSNVLVVEDGRTQINLLQRVKDDFAGEGVASFVDWLMRAGIKNFAQWYEIPEEAARQIAGKMLDNPMFMHPKEFPADFQRFMEADTIEEMTDLLIASNSAEGKALLDLLAGKKTRLNDGLDLIRQRMAMRIAEDVPNIERLVNDVKQAQGQLDEALIRGKGEFARLQAFKKPEVPEGMDTFNVLRNGVKETYSAPKEVVEAIKQLDNQQMNAIVRAVAAVGRVQRLSLTGMSLPFQLGQAFIADPLASLIQSDTKIRNSAANPFMLVKAMISMVKKDSLYKEFQTSGAVGSLIQMSRPKAAQSAKSIASKANIASRIRRYTAEPRELLAWIEDSTSVFDKMFRLANYMGKRKEVIGAGGSEADAIVQATKNARRATADFAKVGVLGSQINAFQLFFNAAVQGISSMAGAAKKNPARFATRATMGLVAPAILSVLYNKAYYPELYDQLSQQEKEGYFPIFTPWSEYNPETKEITGMLLVKLPPGINGIYNMARYATEQMYEEQPVEALELARYASNALLPFEFSERGAKSMIANVPGFGPLSETYFNYDTYRGRAIESEKLLEVDPQLRYDKTTSNIARFLGGVTAGSDQEGGLSPMRIQHVINQQFGSVGQAATAWADTVGAALGLINKEDVGGRGIIEQTRGRFLVGSGGQVERERIERLSDANKKEETAKRKLRKQAEEELDRLRSMTDLEKAEYVEKLKSNPELSKELKKVADGQKMNYTSVDWRLRDLDIGTGARAKAIIDEARMIEDPAERVTFLNDLLAKKIITSTVRGQMSAILAEEAQAKE